MIITIRHKLLLASLLLFFTTTGFAQNQRIIYDFTFQRDSTDVNSKIKAQYALDILKDHSRFVSLTKLKRDAYVDSMRKAIETKGGIQNFQSLTINFGGMGSGAAYEIYKFNNGKTRFQQKFLKDTYGYEEDQASLAWQVTETTEKYGQYNCQLATVNYGGRNWNALFTTDIPISSGPYKFAGLPGLIVKMWDDKNHCLYELAEIKSLNDVNNSIPVAEIVSKKDFKKVEENTKIQASAIASGMVPAGAGGATTTRIIRNQNGEDITPEQAQRMRAEAEKKNNNTIEL